MHPEEIKNHIPEVLYLDYKKKFNKKRAREGGNRYTQHMGNLPIFNFDKFAKQSQKLLPLSQALEL